MFLWPNLKSNGKKMLFVCTHNISLMLWELMEYVLNKLARSLKTEFSR